MGFLDTFFSFGFKYFPFGEIHTKEEMKPYWDWAKEMGWLKDFYHLTPPQIKDGYQGYIQLIYNLGNLYIVADRKAKDPNASAFVYQEPSSRESAFNKFNMEEK